MICLYDGKTPLKEENFENNGLVVLSDCKSCFIEEKLNDSYELTLEYPIDDRGKWQYLLEKNIIKADGQLFRIYHKEKNLEGITVNARHIFYDLLDNFVEKVNIVDTSGVGAVDLILNNTQFSHPFKVTGDVTKSASASYVRKNVVETIMSSDTSDDDSSGSILNNYGGELERDNFNIKYWNNRGEDRGLAIRYGKNIVGVEETLDMDDVVTRIMPVGKDGVLLTEKYVDSKIINNYPNPIVREVEFSEVEDESKLKEAAQAYLETVDKPTINYTVDFIELTKTEEYKAYKVLESVYMGDTVTVKHSRLGIDLKAEVIRIKKNVLTERIEEVELGDFKKTLSDTFGDLTNSISDTQTMINKINNDFTVQLDGKIESYYQAIDPKTWDNKDNLSHNGDMWYKTDSKQLYRFNSTTGNWDEILNKDAIEAYEKASKAQDTADSKRRIFIAQPTVPYDQGDLWSEGKDGDILICVNSRGVNEAYSASDWELASKYTDDTKIEEFMSGVYKTDKENMQAQLDGVIDTWFYKGEPSLFSEPSSTWTDDNTKNNHLGDLYYDTDTGYAYRFALVDKIYSWLKITDIDVTTALSKAKDAKDTADTKRRVFVAAPTPPYDIGDLWFQGDTGGILTCQNSKGSGMSYAEGDFQKLNKYTDDTYAKNIQVGGRNLLRNTGNFKNTDNWFLETGTNQNTVFKIVNDDTYGAVIYINKQNDVSWSVLYNIFYEYYTQLFDTDKEYTLSFMAKSIENKTLAVTFANGDGSNWCCDGQEFKVTDKWTSFTTTFKPKEKGNQPCLYIMTNVGEFWLTNFKLEVGNKATDWTPAPEDTQNQIDKAQKDADTALTTAQTASTSAISAINAINNMSQDSKLSPVEKQALNQTWFAIQAEKSSVDGEADHYGIDKSSYDNSYSTLELYITPLLSDVTTTSDIDSNTFKSNFINYYNAKNSLLQTVVQRVKENLNELENNGVNLIVGSTDNLHTYPSGFMGVKQADKFWRLSLYSTDEILQDKSINIIEEKQYTESFLFKTDGTFNSVSITFFTNKGHHPIQANIQDMGNGIFKAYATYTTQIGDQYIRALDINNISITNGTYMDILNPKLEKGNKATDWTPAPEDTQKQIDDNYNDYKNFVDNTYNNDKSDMQKSIENATATMNSALGGYVLKRNGELLIMDSDNVNSAQKIWRWNVNGLGYSATGYNGPYATAITEDGKINADFITTGELNANVIKVGSLGSQDGSIEFNLDKRQMTTRDSDGNYTTMSSGGITHHSAVKGIRYIRACGTASTSNTTTMEWVDIEAFNANNTNVAFQKTVTCSSSKLTGVGIINVNIGRQDDNFYFGVQNEGNEQYVQIDLGVIEEVKRINVKHIWEENRVYISKLYVSQDGSNWTSVFNSEDKVHRNIRYIRDWLNGSNIDNTNDWVEIQAINSQGQNVAQGKNAWGSMGSNLASLTDGNIDDNSSRVHSSGLSYVVVDLGQNYSDIETLKIFHYYGDRAYHGTRTEVSEDGVTWYSAWSSALDGGEYFEMSSGHSIDVTNVWNRYAETSSGRNFDVPEMPAINMDSEYHYLAYNGEVVMSDTVSVAKIVLPAEFVGKEYKVTVSPKNIIDVSEGYVLKSFMCFVSEQHEDWFGINGTCYVCHNSNWNESILINLAVSYTIIA